MNKIYTIVFAAFLLISLQGFSQTPVPLFSQPDYTYTENFSDINSWTFSSSGNGTFTSGNGASRWRGITGAGTGTTPNPNLVTTSTTSFPTNLGTGGVHKGTESLHLLSTGTADNTTSAAMDFFVNFSNLNAGTLSFDWASVNNNTGNRKGSLKVYASTDGTTFTDITAASVLNFTNNEPTSGSIVNVSLPASLNNSPTARLRFYYYNGTGGTTGSRPKISIDNVKVTGISTAACTTPTAQPTALNFGIVTDTSIQASFTAASPAANGYIVVMSNNNSLSSGPANGTTYDLGDNIGDGSVVSISSGTSFNIIGLTPSTTYYFFVFSMNQLCSGGPLYQLNNPLQGTTSTLAGFQNCATPTQQPTNLAFGNTTINSISGSFTTASGADEFLVVRSTSSTLTATPANGRVYNPGDSLGGGVVVSASAAASFNANGLTHETTYYFFVFSLNSKNCNNGPAYLITAPLAASKMTNPLPPCVTPSSQPTELRLVASNNIINGSFRSVAGADSYLVLYSQSTTLSAQPQDGTFYQPGSVIGNAVVAQSSAASGFIIPNIIPSTQYYIYVFAQNRFCSAGPKYLTTSPLTGNVTTSAQPTVNTYYGNLHSHSSYSDGNEDNRTLIPANDYEYAKNSLCMDFLGISEHNHAGAGMSRSNWQPGLNQSYAATTPNFLALYGMEWGIISGGGHVLVYGVNKLLGWEPGNYDVFVPRNTYTGSNGLFRTINSFGANAFGMLAHPGYSDFNNIANNFVNLTADSAIVGTALESGPAFSTSQTYNDRPFPMAYLDYYKTMLSKGYKLGPSIDHDNHNTNFGRTNTSRLAVMAPSLDTLAFYRAMKSMSFFASQDCDTKVSFNINTQPMGSTFMGNSEPAITIYANDPSNTSAVPKIRLFSGVPGSALLPVAIDSVNGNTFSYSDFNLANNSTAYYYADITIGSFRTVTSPIWYTRNNSFSLPITLLSFTATPANNKTVDVKWSTSKEVNNKLFVIERSVDGINFSEVHSLSGRSNSSQLNSYSWNDANPFDGISYYRLKQIDHDGKVTYSLVVSVNFKTAAINSFSILPNPVQSTFKLNVHSKTNQQAKVIITDIAGRSVYSANVNLVKGQQIISADNISLHSGSYVVTLLLYDEKLTRKLMKL